MRKVSSILALVVGGLSIAGLHSHADAAVGIYYIGASVDSMWGYQRGTTFVQSPGLNPSATYGSTSGGAYLAGTWNFNETSSISAPAGVPGFRIGNGMANGLGTLNASINSDGFSISGSGYAEVEYDTTPVTGTDADVVYANGTAMLSFNFAIPAGGPDYTLNLAGTASSEAYTVLMVRLAGSDGSYPVDFQAAGTEPAGATKTWTWSDLDQPFNLQAGGLYVFDLYANPNFPWADAIDSGPFTATSQFNLVGTFVPEPTAFVLLLGTAALGLRRRGRAA